MVMYNTHLNDTFKKDVQNDNLLTVFGEKLFLYQGAVKDWTRPGISYAGLCEYFRIEHQLELFDDLKELAVNLPELKYDGVYSYPAYHAHPRVAALQKTIRSIRRVMNERKSLLNITRKLNKIV